MYGVMRKVDDESAHKSDLYIAIEQVAYRRRIRIKKYSRQNKIATPVDGS